MRRFFLTHFLVFIVILGSFQLTSAAALLSEGFEDVPNLPVSGWFMINHSNPQGITDWFNGDETNFPAQAGAATSYAAANYDNTSGAGTISNWLLSPVLNFAAISQFSFYTRTVDAPVFPDRLQVRVSTSGASTDIGTTETDTGVFSAVPVDINPTLTPAGYPSIWTQYVITGAELPASGTGRIAFRYFVTDAGPLGTNADYIGIDTVEVLSTSYTLTYAAGVNGTIIGTTPQTVDYGMDGTAVTAIANSGYHFVNWSDGSLANPRTDINVTANIAVTANFASDSYFLTEGFEDVPNLTITGWYLINHSNPLGITDWFNGDETNFPAQAGAATSYAAANFDNTSGTGTISNWLLSPVLNFAAISQFSFYTRTVDAPVFPDRLQVRVSTSGASTDIGTTETDTGVFIAVPVDINPTLTTNGFPSTWTQYTLTSAELPASGTGRIAFRYFVTDAGSGGNNSDYIGIDTVEVLSRSYTLNYIAGANGAISGTTPQSVAYGLNGTAVTAVPNANYHFVDWSDGSTTNPRTDTNVTANINVTANFAINTYTLTYTAGTNGTISGTTPQTVNYGVNGTPVTAVPATGYHFVNWSDSSTANPRTDTNVTADITVTANFAIDTFTLTYNTDGNGTISGTTPQTVNYGANGSPVTAVPATGYHFVNWSDSSTANPRTDTNVTADITVTANFAIDTFTLTYNTDGNGTISGTTPQTVNYGANGSPVTAVPGTGYHFVDWSDGSTPNPRTDTNVTADITVTANFAIDTYTLTVVTRGSGSGAVTSDIAGIDCPGDCDEIYDYATVIMLTAAPATGSTFKGWSGDCTGTETTCTVTMDQARNITAEFNSFPWPMFLPAITGSGPTQP